MKKSVNIEMAALLAIAMAAALNAKELNAQVRSSASRSRSTAARSSQVDNRNGSTQNRMDDRTAFNGKVGNKDQNITKDQSKFNGHGNVYDNKSGFGHKDDVHKGDVHKGDAHKGGGNMVVYRPERRPAEIGKRPVMAPVPVFTAADLRLRTNATRIVVYTNFFTKAEAYAYVSNLMARRFYDIDTYDMSYGWFNTTMTAIPTPYGWSDPFGANQFRIRFDFKRSGAGIKIYVTAQWRESIHGGLHDLRFQSSDRYSTFYAWNILEDIASAIPHNRVVFQ